MIGGYRLTSIMPKDIGRRRSGSYCLTMARYISPRATAIIRTLPRERLKKAVW